LLAIQTAPFISPTPFAPNIKTPVTSEVYMKKFSVSVCTLAVAALLGSSLSFAGDHGKGHGRDDENHNGRHGRQWEDQRNGPGYDQRDGRWNDRRPDYNARGPEFHRGGYISREYRGRGYEVDYREHRLSRPPYGHRWVQVGADYVLIAIATGVIANIILSR
jgi:Ni/Co efflux regulator RcnB